MASNRSEGVLPCFEFYKVSHVFAGMLEPHHSVHQISEEGDVLAHSCELDVRFLCYG